MASLTFRGINIATPNSKLDGSIKNGEFISNNVPWRSENSRKWKKGQSRVE